MFNSESIVNTSNPVYRRRHFFNKVMLALSGATVVFAPFWLCWIILTLMTKGGSALSLSLLSPSTQHHGEDCGLLNAIFGSVAMGAVATIIGTHIGEWFGPRSETRRGGKEGESTSISGALAY